MSQEHDCPKCAASMETLEVIIDERSARLTKCSACAGMWLDFAACQLLVGGALDEVSRAFVRDEAPGNPTTKAPSPSGYRESARTAPEGACPVCAQSLASYVTDPAIHGARIALDLCAEHGTFFDAGEARALLTAVEMKLLRVLVESDADRASASWSRRERLWNGLVVAILGPVVAAGAAIGLVGPLVAVGAAAGAVGSKADS